MQDPFNFKKNTLGFAFWISSLGPPHDEPFWATRQQATTRGEATSGGGGGLATDFPDSWQVLEWAF